MAEQPSTERLPYGAFLAAQRRFYGAVKDSTNPHYKSKYADLGAVWGAASLALHENGLTVTQPIRIADNGQTVVVTTIRYQDGTVIETSECPVICKAQNDPQALGSAITYARRYSLASILCIITEDDDGETAMVRSETVEPTRFIKAPYVRHNKSSLPDEKDWQSIISGITDADGLNRCKKQITSAKLEDATFKQVWGMLSAMSKQIGASYDKESKSFSQ